LIVSGGYTLHQSLKVYETLKSEGKNISIIDIFSIQPLDRKLILETA